MFGFGKRLQAVTLPLDDRELQARYIALDNRRDVLSRRAEKIGSIGMFLPYVAIGFAFAGLIFPNLLPLCAAGLSVGAAAYLGSGISETLFARQSDKAQAERLRVQDELQSRGYLLQAFGVFSAETNKTGINQKSPEYLNKDFLKSSIKLQAPVKMSCSVSPDSSAVQLKQPRL